MSKSTFDKSIDIVLNFISNPLKRKADDISNSEIQQEQQPSQHNIQRHKHYYKKQQRKPKQQLNKVQHSSLNSNSTYSGSTPNSYFNFDFKKPESLLRDIYRYSIDKLSIFAKTYIFDSNNSIQNHIRTPLKRKPEDIKNRIQYKLSKPNLNLKYIRIQSINNSPTPNKRYQNIRMIDNDNNNNQQQQQQQQQDLNSSRNVKHSKKEDINSLNDNQQENEIIEIIDSDSEQEENIDSTSNSNNEYFESKSTKLSNIDSKRLQANKAKNRYSIENLVKSYQNTLKLNSDSNTASTTANNVDSSAYKYTQSLNYPSKYGNSDYLNSSYSTPQFSKTLPYHTNSGTKSNLISPIKSRDDSSFLSDSNISSGELKLSDLDTSVYSLYQSPKSTTTTTTTAQSDRASVIRNLRPKVEELDLKGSLLDDFRDKLDIERQKTRDTETNSLLKKLDDIHKSNKYSILKQLNERIELEKNAKPQAKQTTPEEETIIKDTLKGNEQDVVSKIGTLAITKYDIKTLNPGKWLNDEVINFYMELMKQRQAENPGKYLKCHFFNTFFYPMLCNNNGTYNYDRVKKWTNSIDIFSLDKIIIPIHLGNHWCLAAINFKAKQFEYYDSLLGTGGDCIPKLKKYVADEMNNRSKKGIVDLNEFKSIFPKDIPCQSNGYDCGVFMCKYADFSSRGLSFTFTQKDITLYRRMMILELINKKMN
ncbi:sentrin/SUMO-specific protease [Tieghemostelium lacteum]|uniref:Sentrin/SUMO-specific protease n=1 Tax=Tieghemostelium lacteum TaxID=361077 RepID=A0A152A1L9_TIELA|nr:sentrin/SUMO-specific protease [Tieghemostelium lacteum]|eukprot:KYR00153.1 sentrin/SUMO-specific protease [Tieghemostelium lacteum]